MTSDPSAIPLITHYMPSEKKVLPDYEVESFLAAVVPGLRQNEIAAILNVSRDRVRIYRQEGMPASKARELLGWRLIQLQKQNQAITDLIAEYDL